MLEGWPGVARRWLSSGVGREKSRDWFQWPHDPLSSRPHRKQQDSFCLLWAGCPSKPLLRLQVGGRNWSPYRTEGLLLMVCCPHPISRGHSSRCQSMNTLLTELWGLGAYRTDGGVGPSKGPVASPWGLAFQGTVQPPQRRGSAWPRLQHTHTRLQGTSHLLHWPRLNTAL